MRDRLPNLLIAGVPKAGTSSLFSYLAQHPQICPASVKEPGYFSKLIPADGVLPPVESYRRIFVDCSSESYVMEATPSYCYGGQRLLRAIEDVLGRPRVLLLLRDPVDRLWSAYTFQRSLGNLPGTGTFEEYIARCEAQRRAGNPFIVRGHLNGLSIGFYGDYLGQWFKRFPDVKVIFFEELSHSPSKVVEELCRWLSIDSEISRTFDYAAQNVTVHPRSATMSRLVFGVKARADSVLRRLPRLRQALRSGYLRLNAAELKETMKPQTRKRLEELYCSSNRAAASILLGEGYDRLPRWLSLN
jgi:hypothetical protein